MRICAYVTAPASALAGCATLAALAALLAPPQGAAPTRPALPAPGPSAAASAAAVAPPVTTTAATSSSAGRGPATGPSPGPQIPGSSRGFGRPYEGFAPAGTVLHRTSPGRAGLDPRPLDAFARQLAEWTDPAHGAGYLFPGATALLAHEGTVVARLARGDALRYGPDGRELPPAERVPARTDTVYDLASLSKLFTSLVAAQQIDAGRLRLDAPAARYLPGFAAAGKARITIRQLLTHTSGLPADPRPPLWQISGGREARARAVLRAAPLNAPGTHYRYSDLNMLSTQLVLEKVTGKRLDTLVREGITEPLGMTDTAYNPPHSWWPRIAATSNQRLPDRGGPLRGSVHDANAWAMGGVAGHAGVFSTVDDLALLAQALLNGGTYRGHRILSRHAVTLLERDYNRRFPGHDHGLGFELNQPWYMGGLTAPRTLGHTGFTGTSLVIDPASRSFAILLTNRVHPDDATPSTNPARRAAATALARAIPARPPGGGRSWYAEPKGGAAGTLTTPALHADGPLTVSYDALVDSGAEGGLVLERSTDGSDTWRAVAGTRSSGHGERAWQHVRVRVDAAPSRAGLRLRWRFSAAGPWEGRGADVAGVRVTDATRVLFASDCPHTPLTAHGWRPLARPWPLAPGAGTTPDAVRCGATPRAGRIRTQKP
ncbi:serine hydrolase domain-containing protein [Streptomyces diacarni]|uniref:serine hydrolase domain-containing protein n=1 Tax=Streptomyces diacarni TaxID=2800381 RepID=UPI001FE55FF0|nr:serine hydrolase [Streptomyces diacarni]